MNVMSNFQFLKEKKILKIERLFMTILNKDNLVIISLFFLKLHIRKMWSTQKREIACTGLK